MLAGRNRGRVPVASAANQKVNRTLNIECRIVKCRASKKLSCWIGNMLA